MPVRTIVVVEDEDAIASAIAARLRSEGFQVEVAADGPSGVELCEKVRPDLVVLDLMLPGLDGLEVCRRIQKDRPVPVVMLTARDSETDMLVGLAVGADDYLTKPFSPRELVARIHAVLRRMERTLVTPPPTIAVADIEIEPASRQVRRVSAQAADAADTADTAADVHLTPTEFDLLVFLATNRGPRSRRSWTTRSPNQVHTRMELLDKVWGWRDGSGLRTVDSHVRSLRRKLGAGLIRTVHGVGYALDR